MKKKIHIISHTHWDREWYLSSRYVNRWIPIFFENLFQMLEKEPEYRFVLDGQTAIIDDCCEELRKKDPGYIEEFLKKLSGYVMEGRIVTGPYYLQPDWQLISDEAVVRNLLYGKAYSEKLGKRSDTGWLLDNFGQISQAVQIHEQFGIKGLVVWRGVGFDPKNIKSEFYWESPDGSKLPTVYLLSSYRNAMRLTEYPNSAQGRIISEADKIESFAQTDNLLLMNGYDQEMEPDDILPYVKAGKADTEKYEVMQSTPDEYFDAVNAELELGHTELPVLKGALYSGRYISVFPGILSSRMYLKLKNDAVQRRIEDLAEPLGVMATFAGIPYPAERLEKAWKLLLKNHPHDSICGVSADDVHEDMEIRFRAVEKDVTECIKQSVQGLASVINTKKFTGADKIFHVFNTTLQPRKKQIFLPVRSAREVIVKDECGKVYVHQRTDHGLAAEIQLPAFGYRTVGVYPAEEKADREYASGNQDALPVMENEYLRVEFQRNGSFILTDKNTGTVYRNMGYLEDCADSGDEYNFSYVKGDISRTTLTEEADISIVEQGNLRTVVKVEYRWELPCSLLEDRSGRSRQTEILPVSVFAILEKSSSTLRFRTKIRNRCRDHRVRVMFPTYIDVDCSYARTQFDITRHELTGERFDDTDMPDNVKRIVVGARESEPITQFPQRESAAVTDGQKGIVILNKGLPEYEVLPEKTTVALTLFRSVSWLARTDLNTRIGDAGPEIFTPDAQCLRDMEFDYGVSVFAGEISDAKLLEKETDMNHDCITVETTVHPGSLEPSESFLKLTAQGDIQVTAVKQAEDGEGVILRCFHSGEKEEDACLSFGIPVTEVFETNLSEESKEKLVREQDRIEINIPPRRIVTMRILPAKKECMEVPQCAVCLCGQEPLEFGDFDPYPIPPSVTELDVRKEELRAQRAEKEYERALADYQQEIGMPAECSRHAKLKLNMEIRHRTALEARLSATYTKKKYAEAEQKRNSKEIKEILESADRTIQELGDELNTVRVERRAAEYWVDYYLQKEKEQDG